MKGSCSMDGGWTPVRNPWWFNGDPQRIGMARQFGLIG
jgi:hypothetical protein